MEEETALLLQAQPLHTFKLQPYDIRISVGSDDEIIFQSTLVAVVDHIHTGIDLCVVDLAYMRYACEPLARIVAKKVVALSRLFLQACHLNIGIGTDKLHTDDIIHSGIGIFQCRPLKG